MIRAFRITNHQNESIRLEIANPYETGILITDVDGLGPPPAEISTEKVGGFDGSFFLSSTVAQRNVVFNVELIGGRDVATARRTLYRHFPIRRLVNVVIETDLREYAFDGYVEKLTPVIFSKSETVQISLIAPEPYLKKVDAFGVTEEAFSALEPKFEFPFSNESLSSPLIIFGDVTRTTTRVIINEGDVEAAGEFIITARNKVDSPTIVIEPAGIWWRLDTSRLQTEYRISFDAGDTLTVVSNRGKKSVTLYDHSASNSYNVLRCVDRMSVWPQLSEGKNEVSIDGLNGTGQWLDLTIKYYPLFEGV